MKTTKGTPVPSRQEAEMQEKKVNGVWVATFGTINEFKSFITETGENKVFKGSYWLDSKSTNDYTVEFTGTKTFDEAVSLLEHGWTDKAKELTRRLAAVERDMAPVMKQQRVVGVAGYQPIVPLFLMGSPASMYSTKMKPVKQKVVTLVKSISYNGNVSADEWTEQGLKALAIVKKLETNGHRVNVDIVRGGWGGHWQERL